MEKTFELSLKRNLAFDEALKLQLDALARLRRGRAAPGLLLLCEHTPVVTLGRTGSRDNLLVGEEGLSARGIEFREVRRGGDVTYHGPGQITLYPVFPLDWWGRDLHRHLRRLEEVGIRFLERHGLKGERIPGLTGVWVEGAKISAIGIAVSSWITYYGASFNIMPDMEHFALIRPCGITDRPVTSLAALRPRAYDMDSEMRALAECFLEVFAGAEVKDEG